VKLPRRPLVETGAHLTAPGQGSRIHPATPVPNPGEKAMAGFCFSGPQARYHLLPEIDDGTLCRQVSPLPGPVSSFYLLPELHSPGFVASFDMIDADKEEFQIVKTMNALKSNHDSFKDAKDYVSYRDRYFGSSISYFLFAADSDAELANTSWGEGKNEKTLKSQIQFNGKNEGTKQQIFYRWVRKAYKLKFGGGFNVPETIRKGKSEQLIKKLNEVRESARVKKIHDENFSAGGFDARPQRYNEKYLLGTLSEHATGMAIDIDDSQNPQFTLEQWDFIETFVGKHITRSGRWGSEEAATGLWKDFKEINDLFVKKIKDETKNILEARAKAAREAEQDDQEHLPAPKPTGPLLPWLPPLQEILGKHFSALAKWATDGFFHLPLELVLELHAHGFNWGATFGTNVDLMHFELPTK
jgi:hypothetical protein